MNDESLQLARVAVAVGQRLNSRLFLGAMERCGGFEGFFRESDRAIQALFDRPGDEELPLARKGWLEEAERELRFMQREGVCCCDVFSPRYPSLLGQCADAPLVIFYKGTLEATGEKALGVVGTRKASERCKARVELLLKEIAEMRYAPVVVSGLAYGIDAAAHQAALAYGLVTRAVMGHGLHTVYPASHKQLSERIIAQGGCLMSEYSSRATVLPVNFLQRNRLVAGMSNALLVAESAVKGGAMSTARRAFEYNREVLAFPGRPEDALSAGCNFLIKMNVASLATETEDVLRALGWEARVATAFQTSLDLFAEPEREGKIVTTLREQGEMHVDQLSVLAGIPVAELTPLLLKMELEGVVMPLPGNRFALC
ncbi:MAG: DNA-processing protein DprA [Odoribacteraceae bacterium]|nr:DNA-processing protein DprA [Odoribacteraceae bacterium]